MRRLRSIAVLTTLVAAMVLMLTARGPAPTPRPLDALACAGAMPRIPPTDWCLTPPPEKTPTPSPTATPWPWISVLPSSP